MNSKKLTGYSQRHSRSVIISRIPLYIYYFAEIITALETEDKKIAIIDVRLTTADS